MIFSSCYISAVMTDVGVVFTDWTLPGLPAWFFRYDRFQLQRSFIVEVCFYEAPDRWFNLTSGHRLGVVMAAAAACHTGHRVDAYLACSPLFSLFFNARISVKHFADCRDATFLFLIMTSVSVVQNNTEVAHRLHQERFLSGSEIWATSWRSNVLIVTKRIDPPLLSFETAQAWTPSENRVSKVTVSLRGSPCSSAALKSKSSQTHLQSRR